MDFCLNCPFRDKNLPRVEFDGNCKKSIVIVGMCPADKEVEAGKPFAGKSGILLDTALTEAGLTRDDVLIGNVCKCYVKAGDKLDKKVIDCCKGHILEEINRLKPKVVITLGEDAFYGISGKSHYSSYRFIAIPYPENGFWLLPLPHPSFILRSKDEGLYTLFKRGFKYAKILLNKNFPNIPDCKPTLLYSPVEIVEALDYFKNSKNIAFDFETSALHPYNSHKDGKKAHIVSVAISDGVKSVAFPLENYFDEAQESVIKRAFVNLMKHTNNKFVFNLAFENKWLINSLDFSFGREHRIFDTMILSYIVYTRDGLFGLKPLVRVWLGKDENYALDVKDVYAYLKQQPDYLQKLLEYNALDAYYTYHISKEVIAFIKKCLKIAEMNVPASTYVPELNMTVEEARSIAKLYNYFMKQMRLFPIAISKTEFLGVFPDTQFLDTVEKQYLNELYKNLLKIYQMPEIDETSRSVVEMFKQRFGNDAGKAIAELLDYESPKLLSKEEKKIIMKTFFNIKSPKQLTEHFLKQGCNLPKTGKGNYSANEDALRKLSEEGNKLADKILTVRALHKKLSSYVYKSRDCIYEDGKFHPNYKLLSERTARVMCSDINIQQFPKRKGKELRRIIKAPEGYRIVKFDYSALEVRVLAMLSKDPVLIDYIRNGIDFHLEWSKRIYGKELAEENRSRVKNGFVFPLFYGAGLKTVATHLHDVSEKELEKHMNDFWNEFKGVKRWQEKVINDYRKYGFSQNYFGRRRYAPLKWNMIINYPIQSTAVEFTLNAWLSLVEKGYWIAGMIHDELILYVPDDENEIRKAVKDIYECAVKQPWKCLQIVPLDIEVSVGYNWADVEEINLQEYLQ